MTNCYTGRLGTCFDLITTGNAGRCSLARSLATDVCLSSLSLRRTWTGHGACSSGRAHGARSSEWQTGFSILVTSLVPMLIYFRIKSTAMKPRSAVQSSIHYLLHVQHSLQATVRTATDLLHGTGRSGTR